MSSVSINNLFIIFLKLFIHYEQRKSWKSQEGNLFARRFRASSNFLSIVKNMFTLWVHVTKAYITKMLNEQIIMFLARIKHLIFPRLIQHRTKLSERCNVPDSFLMSNGLELKHMPMPCSEVFVPFKRFMWDSSDWHRYSTEHIMRLVSMFDNW